MSKDFNNQDIIPYEYQPEFAQALFGNPWFTYDAQWSENGLRWLLEVIHESFGIDYDIEPEFASDLFDLRPYYWGEGENESALPNFHYKPLDIKISWYKFVGRGMNSNLSESPENWSEIIQECAQMVIQAASSADIAIDEDMLDDDLF